MRKLGIGLMSVALAASPLAAQGALGNLSRSTAVPTEENALGGSNSNQLFFFAGIAAVALAVVFLSEDEDEPVSAG